MMSRLATQLSCKKAHFCDRHHRASAMAGLASYLSIEPHMRSFDGFPTLPNSAPLARGLFFAARPPASRELFPPSEPRRLAEQARNRDHHSRDPYGQTRKQQKIAQERRHIAPPLRPPSPVQGHPDIPRVWPSFDARLTKHHKLYHACFPHSVEARNPHIANA